MPKTPNKKLRTSKLKAEQKAESSVEGSSETEPSKEERTESDDVTNKEDTSASPVQLMTSIDQVADVPVFNNEEDKMAFEDSLNVDLSGIDHMFKVSHVISNRVRTGPWSAWKYLKFITGFSRHWNPWKTALFGSRCLIVLEFLLYNKSYDLK